MEVGMNIKTEYFKHLPNGHDSLLISFSSASAVSGFDCFRFFSSRIKKLKIVLRALKKMLFTLNSYFKTYSR